MPNTLKDISLAHCGIALIEFECGQDTDEGGTDRRPDKQDQLDPSNRYACPSGAVDIAAGRQDPVSERRAPKNPSADERCEQPPKNGYIEMTEFGGEGRFCPALGRH